jgi:predicted transcriptional regulator
MGNLPELSPFELQCLRRLWRLGQASVRDVHRSLDDPPSYSTVRKIFERLEQKGAVERVRLEGKAWVYRSAVSPGTMVRKEIGRFLDAMFDGAAAPLVQQLADMERLTLQDLREIEKSLGPARSRSRMRSKGRRARGRP